MYDLCTVIIETYIYTFSLIHAKLKVNLCQGQENSQQAVIDEFVCMVVGCGLGTHVCHWIFFFFLNVNMVQGQQDSPLMQFGGCIFSFLSRCF